MISSTIKRATAIYRVNSLLLFFSFFALPAFSQELHSFCFKPEVNVLDVQRSLADLLLPKDIIEIRKKDNCIDLIVSADRGKLFEKFLIKRYDLVKEKAGSATLVESDVCQLNVRTTSLLNKNDEQIKLGQKNSLSSDQKKAQSATTMELLVGGGIPSEFEAEGRTFKVICFPAENEKASLTFSYNDTGKVKVSTQVFLKKGEWLNLASIKNDLDEKSSSLGIPQSQWTKEKKLSETIYELQYK